MEESSDYLESILGNIITEKKAKLQAYQEILEAYEKNKPFSKLNKENSFKMPNDSKDDRL